MKATARTLLPAIALCAVSALPALGADRVKTANGTVESTVPAKDGVRSFKGFHSRSRRSAICAGANRSR